MGVTFCCRLPAGCSGSVVTDISVENDEVAKYRKTFFFELRLGDI